MGRLKNEREDRSAKKREKSRRKKMLGRTPTDIHVSSKPPYAHLRNDVLSINFGPKPKIVTAKEVAEACGGRWRRNSSNVRCPAHNDDIPSLSVAEGQNGTCLLHCHAGCTYSEIVAALIYKYAILPKNVRLRHPTLGTPSSEFNYRDANGIVVLKICRFNQKNGKKTYRAYLPSEDRWEFPRTRILYNLPRILNEPAANVLIVEGEKTANAAQRLFPEYVVTTWPGGANADFAKIDFSPLKKRNIVIFADNDDAGKKAAIRIQEIIGGKICMPSSNIPEGWDLADIPNENVLEEIRNQIEALFQKPITELSDIKSVSELYDKEIPKLKSTVEDVFVEGVTLFAGRPKIGKSRIMLQLCVHVALGKEFLGKSTNQGKVLYIALEDSERRMQDRLKGLPRVPNNFSYALSWPKPHEGGLTKLEHAIDELGFNLIVIDTLAKFRGVSPKGKSGGDTYVEDYDAISRLVELAYKKRVCLVFVHHLRKALSNDDYFDEVAGSTGLTAAPDSVFALKKKIGVSNRASLTGRGRDIEEIQIDLTMVEGIWQIDEDAQVTEIGSPIKRRIIDCLRQRPGLSPRRIADAIGMSHNSIRVYVRQLTENGLLTSKDGRYYLKTDNT